MRSRCSRVSCSIAWRAASAALLATEISFSIFSTKSRIERAWPASSLPSARWASTSFAALASRPRRASISEASR
ncbi:hypothetical protein [Bosea thiooxidans]